VTPSGSPLILSITYQDSAAVAAVASDAASAAAVVGTYVCVCCAGPPVCRCLYTVSAFYFWEKIVVCQ
jgi:hypothetical protein